jgi:hypothetical protein
MRKHLSVVVDDLLAGEDTEVDGELEDDSLGELEALEQRVALEVRLYPRPLLAELALQPRLVPVLTGKS